MLFNGYPVCPALTSLVLLASLLFAAASPPPRQRCSDIRRLYSPRVLRELRIRLMIAYAQSHERRAAEIAAAIRNHTAPAIQPKFSRATQIDLSPQESDGPRMKHLLAYVAMNCL